MHETNLRPRLILGLGLALSLSFASACGGGGGGGSGSSSRFVVVEVSNGFGKLLPYQISLRDAQGQPTGQLVEITRMDQLIDNVTANNPIRPPTQWPLDAILPNSLEGNQFLAARFSQPIDPNTVLSSDSSDAPASLGAGIQVQIVHPTTGVITPVKGRAFVGGQTFGPTLSTTPGQYELQTWVEVSGSGLAAVPINAATPGLGFPGTEPGTGFGGDVELVDPSTFVFVADADGDLATKETFPGGQIQMRIGTLVGSLRGKHIEEVALASTTVGPDVIPPEVAVVPGLLAPRIVPGNGMVDVDPQANIVVEFTEPVQPISVGAMDDGSAPQISSSIRVSFGPDAAEVQVPFSVRPLSVFDLSRYELSPSYDFPGTGPVLPGVVCDSIFGTVEIELAIHQIDDLALVPNNNGTAPSTVFSTREGPGIVNAPVAPDAIYIGRTGSFQGISVIDLNGFGGTTGNPTYSDQHPTVEGNSNFPNNPNVALTGAQLIPPLSRGDCTFNGGSGGAFTLVKDSSLQDIIAGKPLLESVGDMALGHSLDNTFNNELPFGCQSGGGNICAVSGLKNIAIISSGPNTVASQNIAPQIQAIKIDSGTPNLVSWAPHPNPPPLIFPPLCLSPLINALEPTSIDSTFPPPPNVALPPFPPRSGPGLRQLLVPGDFYFGIPEIDLPPQSAVTKELNSFFEGPSLPQPTVSLCAPYMVRQQVGHFMYVVDRVASEIVVFNSNRFTVLDRIRLLDPTSLAMSPNLDFLAVTNEGADQVSFIDIDPSSATFHQVVKTTTVGTGPTGIAWEPGNEDIFVCNQGEGTVSVISGFTLDVRKTLRNQISRPIDVALTPRQQAVGFLRNVYFGYILNQNGRVAFFESGPDGVNGIGFDNTIGTLPFRFDLPKAMQVDVTNLNSAVWIVHENPLDPGTGAQRGNLGDGAISTVGIKGGTIGAIPLNGGPFGNPQVRQLEFGVFSSFGPGEGLSGIPVDIAFDNMRNLTALTNFNTPFSPGNAVSYNGKNVVKTLGGAGLAASAPQFMFAAVPNPGVIDVFDTTGGAFEPVDTNPFVDGTQSIPAPNASVLMDYFRQ